MRRAEAVACSGGAAAACVAVDVGELDVAVDHASLVAMRHGGGVLHEDGERHLSRVGLGVGVGVGLGVGGLGLAFGLGLAVGLGLGCGLALWGERSGWKLGVRVGSVRRERATASARPAGCRSSASANVPPP